MWAACAALCAGNQYCAWQLGRTWLAARQAAWHPTQLNSGATSVCNQLDCQHDAKPKGPRGLIQQKC